MRWLRMKLARWRLRKTPGVDFSAQDQLIRLADGYGYPHRWIVCEFCGAHSWQFPPHMADGCPLVTDISQSAGLRMDAERMTHTRLGVHLEETTRRMNELFGEGKEDE